MTTTTINIRKLLKENLNGSHVSEAAIQEIKDRFEIWFEINTPVLVQIAARKRRKTIFPEDVVEFFSGVDREDLQ